MATNSATNVVTAATGKVLQGAGIGTTPAFSTATYPSTATGTGTMLRADGTNWTATTSTYPNTNAVNTLLYASSANVMAALATANSGVLTTNSSGVPSIDTTNFSVLSTGVQVKGNNTNTTPPAGFLGQRISNIATSVAMSNNIDINLTSISLTAGIWDIGAMGNFTSSANLGTICTMSINQVITTVGGTLADNWAQYVVPTGGQFSQFALSIPSYRLEFSSTTTVYLNARVALSSSSGTISGNGRISATRVG